MAAHHQGGSLARSLDLEVCLALDVWGINTFRVPISFFSSLISCCEIDGVEDTKEKGERMCWFGLQRVVKVFLVGWYYCSSV